MNGGVANRPPAQAPRSTWGAGIRRPDAGATFLSIAILLVVVSLALADGLLLDVVAYERDTTVFYFPLMRWVGQQLHQGVLPLWTPMVFGGYPIFADGEVGLAYPPALLALLALPAERAFVFLRLLHPWIAAVGTFSLARLWRLPRSAAVLAGLVFALGNFLQAQVHHENIVRTAAWLPVILALVEQALRSAAWPGRARWIVFASLALGMAGLGLHSQMLAIDLLVLAGYGALRLWVGPLDSTDERLSLGAWLRRLRSVASVCVPVVVLGLALAAVQLIPLLELASFSPRGSGIPYTESAAYSLTPYGLAQLIFPFIFRGPGNLQWGLWTHWESYLYVGLAPLVLAAIALLCVRRREVLGWGVLAGVGTILALGQYSPLNLHYLLWLLPGLSGLRAPGRFTIVVVLAMAMLSAYGLAWLQHQAAQHGAAAPERATVRRVVRGVAVAALALALAVPAAHLAFLALPGLTRAAIDAAYLILSRDSYPLTQADVYAGLLWASDLGNPHVQIGLGGLFVVAALLGAWQGLRRWSGWSGWSVLLVALAAADLLVFAWGIHPRAPLAKLADEPPAVRALERLALQSSEPSRVLASPVLNQVSADRLAPFGLQDANGYSSLQFAWHRDLLTRVLEVDDDLLDMWNVRYVVDPAVLGNVSSYKGVEFMPRQMLLHSVANSATSTASFALTPGSTITELRLVTALMAAVEVPQDTPVAELELRGPNDVVVARAQLLAGRDTMEWSSDLPGAQPYVRHQRVEVAGLAFEGNSDSTSGRLLSFTSVRLAQPVAASRLVVRAVLPRGELALFGGGVVDDQGGIQQLFGRAKTKYRLVFSDAEMLVFENTAALPRAFLVSQARWAQTLNAALAEMSQRPFDPRREVILAADTAPTIAEHLPPPSAEAVAPGRAEITSYAANAITVRTTASSDALLIVSDTYYPGWRAFLDGQEVPLVRGDLLFRVVPIEPREHTVELRFEPASVRWGLLISGLALLCALGTLFVAGRAGASGRTT